LLFQEKDARAYGWLAVMSLLPIVVAARYSRGVAFGSLLIVYAILGIFALSLLALYSQRQRTHLAERDEYDRSRRWPLAGIEPDFSSTPPGSGRAGIVPEYFARLSLIVAGGLLLATVIFYAAPRPRIPLMRWGDTRKSISVVGFNDTIDLGGLGETLESREEVMRVRMLDPVSQSPYPLSDNEIYLRGTLALSYSHNQWRRPPPELPNHGQPSPAEPAEPADPYYAGVPEKERNPALQIGSPVIQQTTLEPYLNRFELFYIWPLTEANQQAEVHFWPLVQAKQQRGIHYESAGERLLRQPGWGFEPSTVEFTFDVVTTGLVDGRQAELVPARRKVDASPASPLLQMPGGEWPLPRLTALAAQWRRESGLLPGQHKELAAYFERQLSSSGQFHYSLQPVERDADKMDAIEDFVSKNPCGHCEYFATALALMLRSQGIPSRVVLGYRCDEFDPQEHVFQVRQLHAHAWVEAYLAPLQIPRELRQQNPQRWTYGGWLRLDGTPGEDLGSAAADRTTWGAWEGRWHALQHYWECHIADMDQAKQRESVYKPIRAALHEFTSRLFSWEAWRELFVGVWHALARMLRSGIMGKLAGTLLLIVGIALLVWVLRRLARLALWLWRRLFGRGGARASGARSAVEFYRRFEQVVAQRGLFRSAGQTPREFAQAAGARLAKLSGRPELCDRASLLAEMFYSVRFGRQELDAAASAAVQTALEELKAGVATPRPATG
jgi:hypothetical protein